MASRWKGILMDGDAGHMTTEELNVTLVGEVAAAQVERDRTPMARCGDSHAKSESELRANGGPDG